VPEPSDFVTWRDSRGSSRRFDGLPLGLGRTLWFGLCITDGLGQHLAQFVLSLRRFALGWLPLCHDLHVGTPERNLNPIGIARMSALSRIVLKKSLQGARWPQSVAMRPLLRPVWAAALGPA